MSAVVSSTSMATLPAKGSPSAVRCGGRGRPSRVLWRGCTGAPRRGEAEGEADGDSEGEAEGEAEGDKPPLRSE